MSFSVKLTEWPEWVRLTVQEMEAKFPTCSFGTYNGHDPSRARACDAMIPAWQTAAGRKVGDKLAALVAKTSFMRPRGMWYIIWNGRIWSMTRPESGWLPYFDRNSTDPSRSHKNHNHFSWYVTKPKEATVGEAPPPKPYEPGWVPPTPWVFYLDKQKVGVTKSTSVWLIQKALGLKVRDGNYTAALQAEVKAWQLNVLKDEPRYCDGILGRLQARSLFNDAITVEDSSQ